MHILENSVKNAFIKVLCMFVPNNLKSFDIEQCTMKPDKGDNLPVHIIKSHCHISVTSSIHYCTGRIL